MHDAGLAKKANKYEKKLRCNYCKALDHVIKDCPKIGAKEAKMKEASIAIVAASPSNSESANVVQDSKWAFTIQCNYYAIAA